MKRITLLMSVVAVVVVGLAAAIPALAQDQATATEVRCPYHEQADMSHEEMAGWMTSAAHDEWMESKGHGPMHDSMSGAENMMGSGDMMGSGMMGTSG